MKVTAQSDLTRDGIVIFEGPLASLKRFKDDVKEVKAGYECGFVFANFNDIKEGDLVEAFEMVEIPRTQELIENEKKSIKNTRVNTEVQHELSRTLSAGIKRPACCTVDFGCSCRGCSGS